MAWSTVSRFSKELSISSDHKISSPNQNQPKKRKEREASEFTDLIPSLPEELSLECLTRLSYSTHRHSSAVCLRWRHLMQSQDFYYQRKNSGHTYKVACLVQALKECGGKKPGESPSYRISVFDPVSRVWDWIDPVPGYPNGLPLFCQLAGCEGKLVVMGGWDPVSYNLVTDVFVYDFGLRWWRRGKDLPVKMSFFGCASVSGRVYVAGGHDDNKNALRTVWAYDPRQDEWIEWTQLSQERDECEAVVIGDELWVISGYNTENQGAFDGSADVYKIGSGLCLLVEGVWETGRCPRSNVGVGKDGSLFSWSDLDSAIRVGSCGVDLSDRVLVTGSEYQGAPHGFYLGEGLNVNLEKLKVPDDFSGFVQSGCCIEI